METKEVHGYKVMYDDRSESGADYLRDDLSYQEAGVFFEYAKRHGEAQFEDDDDRELTLHWKNGVFILKRRD